MKFGNFLFPESDSPERDTTIIDETLREARLSEELGLDALWLAEHHFDGNCVYVDPVTFATALAMVTQRISIGFAVVQTSLYHPVRLAEQLSLLDNLSKGRLIVGLGRGSIFNIYEYQGYGVEESEAQARFEEAEQIVLKAWSGGRFSHAGRFWSVDAPAFRPLPYSKPHPEIFRAASSEASVAAYGRLGRSFLMNAQTNAATRRRIELYRESAGAAGHSAEQTRQNLERSWVWRSAYIADSDKEAEAIGRPAFFQMQQHRSKMRDKVAAEQGKKLAPNATLSMDGFLCGSPDTVTAELNELAAIGVGGAIIQFRLGAMSHEAALRSLRLFATEVAPKVQA